MDLFIETDNPVHLFNQGRCYEQNHLWEQALDRFHEYMRKVPNPDKSTKDYVDKHIAECESHLPKAAPIPPPPPPEPVQAPSPPPTPAHTPEAGKPSVSAAPVLLATPAKAKDSGSTLKTVGIVTAALGIASIGYGTYEYFRRESLINGLNKNGGQYSDDQFSDKQGQIDGAKTRSLIGFGVGAAALLAGTTMYLLGRAAASSGTEPAKVSLVPGFGPGQRSIFISGAF